MSCTEVLYHPALAPRFLRHQRTLNESCNDNYIDVNMNSSSLQVPGFGIPSLFGSTEGTTASSCFSSSSPSPLQNSALQPASASVLAQSPLSCSKFEAKGEKDKASSSYSSFPTSFSRPLSKTSPSLTNPHFLSQSSSSSSQSQHPQFSSTFSSPSTASFSLPLSPPLSVASPSSVLSSVRDGEEAMAEDDESPKKMQYLTSRSVVLTYFTEETGQVVDDHFSRALGASVSVDNDMSSVTGTNSTDLPKMSQRNLPASFWKRNSPKRHHPYHVYTPYTSHTALEADTGHHGSTSDFSYITSSSQLHGSLYNQCLPPIPSMYQDHWTAFPFIPPAHHGQYSYPDLHCTLPYDRHSLSSGLSSRTTGSAERLFAAGYGSLHSSMRPASTRRGHLPSATITSGQCTDAGVNYLETIADHYAKLPRPREFDKNGVLAGLETAVQEAGKDLYWF